jgi:hypothetical protein
MEEPPHQIDGWKIAAATPRIPFVIAAPTVPGFPVCLPSIGFEETRKVSTSGDRFLDRVGRTVGESWIGEMKGINMYKYVYNIYIYHNIYIYVCVSPG